MNMPPYMAKKDFAVMVKLMDPEMQRYSRFTWWPQSNHTNPSKQRKFLAVLRGRWQCGNHVTLVS